LYALFIHTMFRLIRNKTSASRQKWAVFNQDLSSMQVNAEFHVVIDGQQEFECTTDKIFANGFE